MPDVATILSERQTRQDYWQEAHLRFDKLINSYHGNYAELWPGEFRRGEEPKVANWIKLGWDRYSKMVGKLPTHHMMSKGLQRIQRNQADKIEKVLSHYDMTSNMSNLMKWYSWYLVGLGAACMGVLPDGVLKGPRYFIKDPRAALPAPGAGSLSVTSASYGMLSKPRMASQSLESILFNETMPASYIRDHYPDPDDRLDDILGTESNLGTPHEVLTWIDKEYLCVVIDKKKFLEVEHGLDFVPVRYTTMFVPDQLGGQGQFEQNIGLVLAYMRILNQKLTYNQNVVWPWLVVKGLNNIDSNRRVIEIMDRDGDAAFLSPPGELQIERDLETLDRLIRVMNHDTEAMQGEAPGSIVTGRSIVELNRDVRTQVSDYWEVMKPDIEFLKSAALIIDETMYGGSEKMMHGRIKGEMFEETYKPAETIQGNHAVEVDFGIGVGGFEGFAELMQFAAQGFIDEQTVMENAPWIRSVSETRRKVLLDRVEKLLLEMVASQAPAPVVNHLSEWRRAIERNRDPWNWIRRNPFPEPLPAPEMGGAPPTPEGPPLGGPPTPGGQPGAPTAPAPGPADILSTLMAAGGR